MNELQTNTTSYRPKLSYYFGYLLRLMFHLSEQLSFVLNYKKGNLWSQVNSTLKYFWKNYQKLQTNRL